MATPTSLAPWPPQLYYEANSEAAVTQLVEVTRIAQRKAIHPDYSQTTSSVYTAAKVPSLLVPASEVLPALALTTFLRSFKVP